MNFERDPDKRRRAQSMGRLDAMLDAIRNEQCGVIKAMVADGFDLNIEGGLLMIEAVRNNRYLAARTLWNEGADINLAAITLEQQKAKALSKAVNMIELTVFGQPFSEQLDLLARYKEAFHDAMKHDNARKMDLILENQRDIFRKLEQMQKNIDQLMGPEPLSKSKMGLGKTTP